MTNEHLKHLIVFYSFINILATCQTINILLLL